MKMYSKPNIQSARKKFLPSLAALAAGVLFAGLIAVDSRAATIADWKFDEANPTADSSTNGNTLVFGGDAVIFSSDVATNAQGVTNSIVFDGSGYAQTAGTLNLSLYNAITIECFAKIVPDNTLEMFYSHDNPNDTQGAFYLDLGEAGPAQLKTAQRAASGFVTDTAPNPNDGAWHHYALVMDESGSTSALKIYVDGFEVDGGGVAGPIQGFINDYFTIGAYPPTYAFGYVGEMGEMRISSGALTPAQFLIGQQPPGIIISQQPLSVAAVTNAPATFRIAAAVQNGNPTPKLHYQWQMNGASVSGATNSFYTVPSAVLSENGNQFDVVLSATGAPSITSSNAILTVAANFVVADWQFNQANPAADSSGNGNTLALEGDGLSFSSDVASNASGTDTNSAIFDGAAYAQTVETLNLSLYNAITIEFFAKYTPPNSLQMFFSQNNPNYTQGAFYFDKGEAGPTGLKTAQKAATGFVTDTAAGPTDGNWHHYALVVDESGTNSVLKIYLDGYEVDGSGTTGPIQSFINDYFTIGAYPPGYGLLYDGQLGEMRISFGALTPSQFLTGEPPPRIAITGQPRNTATVTNGAAAFVVNASVQSDGTIPALQYQWQINGSNISGATGSSYTLPSAALSENDAQIDVIVSVAGGPSITSSNAILTVATNAIVADWQFNEANPTADSSGNGNTLAFAGDPPGFSGDVAANAPGATNSVIFDGSAYAQTAAPLNLSFYSAITIEFFAKYAPGNGLQMFFSQDNPNNVDGAFYLDVGEAGPTALKTAFRGAAGFGTDASPGPIDGNWHHFALTMDESGTNSIARIYVDGVEADTGGSAIGIQSFINDYFTIGAYPPSYILGYNGEMGEMRVSFGALTPPQFLVGPALLNIGVGNGNAVLDWPRNAGNFTLQKTGNLLGPWTAVTNSPATNGLYWQVTVPANSTSTYYRLIH
jgi:hypothetical protein